MAAVNATLFFNKNRSYRIGAIVFDLILNESHSFSNTITEYAVEDGSTISDHIQNQLENGSISGLITNFSIMQGVLTSNRAQDAFDKLYQLWKDKELLTLVTVYKVYDDIAIESINIAKDDATGEALIAEITFKKVNIVKLQEVTVELSLKIPNMNSDLYRQAAPNVDLGKTTGYVR